jgi:Bacterial Ig domain
MIRISRRALRALLWTGVMIGLVAGGLVDGGAGQAEASGGVSVSVSYADGSHATSPNFPTPWAGSPGVTFEGCQPPSSCVYDAGAVQVTNNTGASVTVNSVTVHIDTCVYTGWPSATLAPGAQLIVTQLASGSGPNGGGCTGPTPTVMDGSDIGPGGSPYDGICAPDGIQPTVDVTVDGITTTYLDINQVLNSGGFDLGRCPYPTNESMQWSAIGQLTPTTAVLLPSNGATVSGSQYLDASASNATSVEFLLFGGVYGYAAPVVCTATPTYYGWLCSLNSTTVPNGSYLLLSEAFNSTGSTFSAGVGITVDNPPPTTNILIPSNGATLSGSTTLDASASNATSVEFRLFGGSYGFAAPVVCTATLTYYGWVCGWNTTTVPNGSYTLLSEAFNSTGSAFSSGVNITVHN